MEFASSTEDLRSEPKSHVLDVVKHEYGVLHQLVREHLQMMGVEVETKGRESRAKNKKSLPTTPSTPKGSACLNNLVEAKLKLHKVAVTIPKFLKIMVTFIQRHIEEEGLFRKAGACGRINNLITTLNESDGDILEASVSVSDVCTAMKQLLRQMEEPLLPYNLHHILLRSLELPFEHRNEAILLAILLLPKTHMFILFYLMEFLHEVALHSDKNKMDARNLAIVLAPNIMPVTSIPTKIKGCREEGNCSKVSIQKHVEIIKVLIELGDRIGTISEGLTNSLVVATSKNSDDELERRDGRKRKRSASLNRVLDFLRKGKLVKNPVDTPLAGLQSNFTPAIHTPVIMPNSRKRNNNATPMMSTSTKKKFLSVLQKKGPPPPFTTTPIAKLVSPAVCLNPKPRVAEDPKSVQMYRSNQGLAGRKTRQSYKGLSSSIEDLRNENEFAGISILCLTKSPRSSLPMVKTPPSSARNSMASTKSSHYGSTTGLDLQKIGNYENENESVSYPVETMRLTPMVKEIDDLTLAALDENLASCKLISKESCQEFHKVELMEKDDKSEIPQDEMDVTSEKECGRSVVRRKHDDRKLHSKSSARRCESLKDPSMRSRSRIIVPRRKSDGATLLRSKTPSKCPSPATTLLREPRHQSLAALNRSPTRCTLRRGRPNTMRTGLPRPSPSTSEVKPDRNSLPSDVTPMNISLDRKGRVSRRMHTRPALVMPKIQGTPEKRKLLEHALGEIVKPPRTNLKFTSKLQSPKKVTDEKNPTSDVDSLPRLSYVASKLRRETNGTITTLIKNVGTDSPPKNPYRKGRSCSLRNDMIRPSPTICNTLPQVNSVLKDSDSENSGNKISRLQKSIMRRGLSVQELVKKFDSCKDDSVKPLRHTLNRERVGRLPISDFTTLNKVSMAAALNKSIAPPKPPRPSLAETRRTKIFNSKQQAEFNTLTRNLSNNNSTANLPRGSKQVLKTMNVS